MKSTFIRNASSSLTLILMIASEASALSLDDAVNAQLEVFNGVSCGRLLNGDATNVSALTGELAVVCGRPSSPPGGPGASTSSGGAAATPASMPVAVKERLQSDATADGPLRGVFSTLNYGSAHRDITQFEDGYDSDIRAILAGYDQEFGSWVAGFTVEYTDQDGDFDGGGDFESTTTGLTLFAGRALGERAAFDAYVGYNTVSNDRTRTANFTHIDGNGGLVLQRDGILKSDFDASQNIAGARLSYDFVFDNVSIGPVVALDWQDTDYDSYTESQAVDSGLALNFTGDENDSLVSTIGLEGSVGISTSFGAVIIGEYVHWKTEHANDKRNVAVSFAGDTRAQRFLFETESPDDNFLELGVSATLLLQGGLQGFVAYQQTASHAFLDTWMLQLGIRKEF